MVEYINYQVSFMQYPASLSHALLLLRVCIYLQASLIPLIAIYLGYSYAGIERLTIFGNLALYSFIILCMYALLYYSLQKGNRHTRLGFLISTSLCTVCFFTLDFSSTLFTTNTGYLYKAFHTIYSVCIILCMQLSALLTYNPDNSTHFSRKSSST